MATLFTVIDASGAVQGQLTWQQAGRAIRADAAKTSQSVSALDKAFSNLPNVIRQVRFALVTVFVGLATGRLVRGAIDTIVDVEENLVRLRGVANASAEEFDKLARSVENLGTLTRFAADEVAQGELNLARAGFETREILLQISDTLDLAIVGNITLAEATQLTANTLRQFNLDATETERALDALTIVSNRSNTTIEQLGQALKFAGPVAASVGGEIEDAAAAIGVLADRGLQATKGGTRLRQAILRLTAPTAAAQRVIRSLGLRIREVDPERVGIIKAFERLGQANLSAGEASVIFGRRIAGAGLILTQNTRRMRELVDAQAEARGETRRLADEIEDTLAASFDFLRSAVQANVRAFGRAGFAGALRGFIDGLTDGLRVLAGFNDEFRTTETVGNAVAKVIQILGTSIGFVGLALAVKGTVVAFKALNVALLSNPLTAIPAILGLAVGAIIAFREEIADFEIAGVRFGDVLVASWELVVIGFQTAAAAISGALPKFLGGIVDGFALVFGTDRGSAIQTIKSFANTVIAVFVTLGDVIRGILDEITGADSGFEARFDKLTGRVTIVAKKSATDIDTILKRAADNFDTDYIGALTSSVDDFAGAARATLSELTFGLTNDLLEGFDAKLAEVRGRRLAMEFVDGFREGLSDFSETFIGRTVTNIASGIIGRPRTRRGGEGADDEGDERFSVLEAEIAQRRIQLDLLNQGVVDAEREADIIFKVNDARAEGNFLLADAILLNEELADKIRDAQKSLERTLEIQNLFANEFTNTFVQVIEDAARGVANLEQSFRELFVTITRELLRIALLEAFQQIFVTQPGAGSPRKTNPGAIGIESIGLPVLTTLLSSARGNVFSGGNVVPFQRGGLVSSPTLFPLAGSRTGIAGEQGVEGIFPLARDRSGNLGVRAMDGGSRNVTFVQNINTPDANSFRKSRSQIQADARGLVSFLE